MIERTYKVLVLGEAAVGKTSIASVFTTGGFRESYLITVGANFLIGKVQLPEVNVKLVVADTAGQERFRSLLPVFYKGARAAIVVFDITKEFTFEKLSFWVEEIKKNAQNIPFFIVANKIDLEDLRMISNEQATEFAKQHNLEIIEASAKNNINVDEIFTKLAEIAYQTDSTIQRSD